MRRVGSHIILAVLGVAALCSAGPVNETITLVDSARQGRQVKAVVCGGGSAPAALVVFAHGFDCYSMDYAYLCSNPGAVTALVLSDDLVPFLPNTVALAEDQSFLSTALVKLAASNASSPLYGMLNGKVRARAADLRPTCTQLSFLPHIRRECAVRSGRS